MDEILLEIKNVKKYFPVTKGLLRRRVGNIKAVDGVTFSIQRGETFGLVGESGCGKTTMAKCILLVEKITNGSILYEGQDIEQFSKEKVKRYRRLVQVVFQDPFSSLSPRMKVGSILSEPMVVHNTRAKNDIKDRVAELLEIVGLNLEMARYYPHEFSGGQRQRLAVARALALNPDLIILDEPVSALDVSIRAQVMNLLKDIQKQFGLSYLLIAHDLAVVQYMSKTIGVMYLGKLIEVAGSMELYIKPFHPYTKALLSAALPSDPDEVRQEIVLTGEVPSPLNPPSGCRFHPRCPDVKDICAAEEPPLTEVSPGHLVACHSV